MSESWLEYIKDPDSWKPPRPLPGPVETERTLVRLYRRGDGPNLFRAVDESRESILPAMVWAMTDHRHVDDSIYYVEKHRRAIERDDCGDFPMGIFDKSTGQIIGGTGLHRIKADRREVEVGYWICGDRAGQGVCTEAVGGLITALVRAQAAGGWGFRRVLVFNDTSNVGSRRVCEKLGLRLEMRLKQERFFGPPGVDAGYVDILGFAVLANEWDSTAHRAKPGI